MPPSALCPIIQTKCVYSTRLKNNDKGFKDIIFKLWSWGSGLVIFIIIIFLYFSHSKLMPGLTVLYFFKGIKKILAAVIFDTDYK